MKHLAKYVQASEERKRYAIDYSEWLDSGETIATVAFEVETNVGATIPLLIDGYAINGDDDGLILFVSGGDDGETYRVLVTITTSGGQTKEDFIVFVISNP